MDKETSCIFENTKANDTMTTYQNPLDYCKDQMQMGLMTAAQANVKIVQMIGIKIISGKVPADVRKALNAAVKAGELGHLKADGFKPEVYFHKNGKANAIQERSRIEKTKIESLKGIYA